MTTTVTRISQLIGELNICEKKRKKKKVRLIHCQPREKIEPSEKVVGIVNFYGLVQFKATIKLGVHYLANGLIALFSKFC